MKKILSCLLAALLIVGVLPAAVFAADGDVASIGENTYATLAEAITAVKDGETIVLLTDCAENVTIKQTAGKSFTINGMEKTYTGTITIDGSRRHTGEETLTITNVNFVANGEWQSSIMAAKNTYVHNLTVDNCNFVGTDAKKAYGITLNHAYDITVKNTTGTNLYDLVYARTAVSGFTAENVTVTNSGMGFMMPYGKDMTFTSVTLDVTGAGVGIYNYNESSATFENCTINAAPAVWLEQKNTQNEYTLTFKGTNTLNGKGENGEWLTVKGTDAKFTIVVEDAGLDMTKTSGLVVNIDNTYHNFCEASIGGGMLVDRTAENGEAGIYFEIVDLPETTVDVRVELYAGDTYLTYKAIEWNAAANGTTLGCTFYTVGTSSSWEQDEWTAYDNLVPTKAVLYINDVEIASDDVDADLASRWVAFPGTSKPVSIGGGMLVDGTTVAEMIGEAGIYFEIVNLPEKIVDVRVELYAGDTYLTYKAIEWDGAESTTLGCTFYTVGTSSRWEQEEWTAYDNMVPTHAVLFINGEEVARDDVDADLASRWAAFPGTEYSASIGGGLLIDRTAENGEAGIYFEAIDLPAKKINVRVELYSGDTYLAYKAIEWDGAANGTTLGCTFYTVGTSSSWEQDEWTAYDNLVPTKAVLYIDGVAVDTDEDVSFTAQEWVAFPGTEAPAVVEPEIPEDDFDWEYFYQMIAMIASQKYNITATAGEGGTISDEGVTAVKMGKDQTYVITPDEGYAIASVVVNGREVGAVSEYTFKNVRAKHSISVTFVKLPWENPYTDIAETDDIYTAVQFVTEMGLFNGTDDGLFAADENMTRADFVTVLGRLAGVDTTLYTETSFTDVVAGEYYAAYVEWAAANEIVEGNGDETFGVDADITVEETLTILARYAEFCGIKVAAVADLEYADAEDVSDWAEEAVKWAVEKGIYAPAEELAPQDAASRGLIAVLFYNFVMAYAA